jgi:hypothetical protein
MRFLPTTHWLIRASVAILMIVPLVAITRRGPFSSAESRSIDTATVSRLTHPIAHWDGIQSTTDITGTTAAMLATGTLLDPVFVNVDLPLVIK